MRISDWSSDVCSSDLWRCSGRALLRGLRMPDELPAGCHYSRRTRLLDEWRLAVRVWRKDRSEPERERDRKSVVEGKSVSVRVDHGGRRISQKKTHTSL